MATKVIKNPLWRIVFGSSKNLEVVLKLTQAIMISKKSLKPRRAAKKKTVKYKPSETTPLMTGPETEMYGGKEHTIDTLIIE